MERLEDEYSRRKEELEREKYRKMYETDSFSLEDSKRNRILEVEVKHKNP